MPFAFIGGMGYGEMMLVGFIALLLFGKKLPEVARSLGKGVTEFKKGVAGIEDELRDSTSSSPYAELPRPTETQAPQVPKFEPPVNTDTNANSNRAATGGPAAPSNVTTNSPAEPTTNPPAQVTSNSPPNSNAGPGTAPTESPKSN